ncbi:centrosome and spindle pole associated protein 1-like [Corticium candelabrum]|uniref:centrosome and spindle pole associated protein 1-like n=1 Tax=Corticium candelabrum TaxID=121492 RepID=UPI002E2763AE|nr:centrosome and spindle pole associated protein 1-like [Corticium candelabrum]
MSDDLNDFIHLQRAKLERERQEYATSTPTFDVNRDRHADQYNENDERRKSDKQKQTHSVYFAHGPERESSSSPRMPLGNYERKQRQLREERTQDYQLFLQQQQQQQQQPRSEGRHYAKDNHKTSGTTLMLTDRTAEKERLRAERQAEYRAFLEQKQKTGRRGVDNRQPTFTPNDSTRRHEELRQKETSISERRRHLASLRRQEEEKYERQYSKNQHNRRAVRDDVRDRGSRDYDGYDDILERRRQEERRYRSQLYDEGKDYSETFKGREDRNTQDTMTNRRWREDDELDRWAHSFSRRGRRPASIEDTRSPIQHSPTDYGSNRELLKSRTHSAPTSPWQGNVQSVAMLGEKPSRDMLRERQQRYAEELRQQIAEKREVNARNRTHDEAAKDERKPAPILKTSRWSDDEFESRDVRKRRERRQRKLQYADEWGYDDGYDVDSRRDRERGRRMPMDRDWLDEWRSSRNHSDVPSNRGGRVRFSGDDDDRRDQRWRMKDADDYYGISLEDDVPRQNYKRKYDGGRSFEDDSHSRVSGIHTEEKKTTDKSEYRRQLEQQMREKQDNIDKQKRTSQEYDRRKEEEIAIYDPWGKAGAGAPMKDRSGRVITDLRKMRASNEQRLTSGGGSPDDTSGPSGASPGGSQSIPSHVDSQISVPLLSDARREEGFTSGYSYGTDSKQKEITGQNESKTHVLTAQEEYREYLRKQVEEKAAQRAKEAEAQRLEQEREAARIEQERMKMKQEYEAELEQQRRKEEDVKRQNEELMAQQEARRKQMETQKRTLPHDRKRDVRQQEADHHTTLPVAFVATNEVDTSPIHTTSAFNSMDVVRKSPPVPALLNRTSTDQQQQQKQQQYVSFQTSPSHQGRLVQENAGREETREVDETVLHSLSVMRSKLQTEQQRLQEQRRREKEVHENFKREVEKGQRTLQQIETKKVDPDEIFGIARSKSKKATKVYFSPQKLQSFTDPPMSQDIYNKQFVVGDEQSSVKAAADFNTLKYQVSADSQQPFWRKFPQPPTSGGHLDVQQQALIRQQRDELDALHLNVDPSVSSNTLDRPVSKKSMKSLHGESTFIAIEDNTSSSSIQTIKDGDGRQLSARARRRLRQAAGDTQSVSSVSSFDVERVAARNAERLRRLEQITRDASKGTNTDQPEDVLDRFMRQHGLDAHVRRSSEISEKSLEAETLLQPTSDTTVT